MTSSVIYTVIKILFLTCNWSIGASLSEPHTNHTAVQTPPGIYITSCQLCQFIEPVTFARCAQRAISHVHVVKHM